MRTRDEIEDSVYYWDEDADRERLCVRLGAILEVLLDIREMLLLPEDAVEKLFTPPASVSSSSKEV
jgi:hypothetical protein